VLEEQRFPKRRALVQFGPEELQLDLKLPLLSEGRRIGVASTKYKIDLSGVFGFGLSPGGQRLSPAG
jgi:hypothetical protein